MARSSATRTGNGAGSGKGYGGPANGPGRRSPMHDPFTVEQQPTPEAKSEGQRAAIADRQEVLEMFTTIMRTDESPVKRMTAGRNIMDRTEGTPIARNINVNADDLANLDDAALDARIAAAERAIREAGGTEGPLPHGSSRTH